MTAKIFDLKPPPRGAPPGEHLARPETYSRRTERIRPSGVEYRYSEGLKVLERDRG